MERGMRLQLDFEERVKVNAKGSRTDSKPQFSF